MELAKAAVQILAPALPALAGVVGQAVGDLAKSTWNTIKPWLIEDKALAEAQQGVAAKPESKARQDVLVEELERHMKENPAHAADLEKELVARKVIQRVVAEGSKVSQIVFKAEGAGDSRQEIVATAGSTVEGVHMTKS